MYIWKLGHEDFLLIAPVGAGVFSSLKPSAPLDPSRSPGVKRPGVRFRPVGSRHVRESGPGPSAPDPLTPERKRTGLFGPALTGEIGV